MQTFRPPPYTALAFDRCPSLVRPIVAAGCQLHLLNPQTHTPLRDQSLSEPELDGVLRISWERAQQDMARGAYDLLLCFTLEDLLVAASWPMPKLFAPLATLGGDSAVQRELIERLSPLLDGVTIVFAAKEQRESWGLDGEVVAWDMDGDVEGWSAAIERCVQGGVVGGEGSAEIPRVSIVIPLYNKAEYTEKCLYALADNTGDVPTYEVVLVDNASSDWTPYLLLAFEGDVEVLRNAENVGFARANNQGAEVAQGEYLLFLNNDTEVRAGWLQAMVDLADSDRHIGVVGAKLVYPDTGAIQHAGIELVDGVPDHVWRGVAADDAQVAQARDLDMVTGACMLVRRALFEELNGFDVSYLNGVEDVDLCLQARARGYRVVYCAEAVVEHHEGTSDGRFDNVRENLQRFVKKWQGHFDAAGRFVAGDAVAALSDDPPSATVVPLVLAAPEEILRGYWEGPFFVHSSLAQVNREMVLALLREGHYDLGLIGSEPDQFTAATDASYGELAARLGKVPDGPVDFHLRHRWPPDTTRPRAGKLVLIQPWEYGSIPKSWVQPMLANVDQIWAYTSYVRQVYIDGGFDPEKVKVVPLGIDPQRFHAQVVAMDLPTQKRFKFLFVGGTLERKGIDLLLAAYRDIFSHADDVCLVIKDMGTQTFYQGQTAGEQIAELQRDPQCGEILYLTEDLPAHQLPSLYAACDCLVHPYRGEGFGLPVAEAMACALPVIVTQGGACDDFCHADRAFMVPATRRSVRFEQETVGQAWMLEADLGLLGETMRRAYADPTAARQLGLRAADYIAEHFTWARAAATAHATLSELCASPPHQREVAPVSGIPSISVDMPQSAQAEESRNSVVVALGGDGAQTLDAIGAALDGHVVGYEVTLSEQVGLGDQLEVIRQAAKGDFIIVLRRGVRIDEETMRTLLGHLLCQDDLVVVEACSPQQTRGVGIEEVDDLDGDLLVFRRAALDAIGGFDRAFSTGAVLYEVVRQLCRQGGRAVRVLECVLEKTAEHSVPEAAEKRERESIEALDKGDVLRGEGQRREALSCYRRSVEAKGNFVEAIIVLAALLLEEDLAAEAVVELQRLIDLDSASFQAHNYLGMAQHQAGDLAAAHASFDRAHQLNPDYAETLVNLSVLAWERGEAEQAISFLERAAELEPNDRDVIVNTAVMQAQSGNVEGGVQLLHEYVKLNAHDLEAVRILADILLEAGDGDSARVLAKGILRQRPEDVGAKAIMEKLFEQEQEQEES